MNQRAQKFRQQVYTHTHGCNPVLPIRVTIALVSRWGPGDSYAEINRPVLSFNLVTRGNLFYRQGANYGTLERGELFIAQKGRDQCFETGNAGFLHKRSIRLEGVALDAIMRATGLSAIDRVHFDHPARITDLFRRCYRLMRDKPPGFANELSVLAYAVINECCHARATKHPAPVRAAIEFMERNLRRRPSLPEIAEASGLSVRHCIRVFRMHLKESPVAFFIELKMSAAKAMLTYSALSIKQIADQVGYDDQFHFSAQFKRRNGQSPRVFRQERHEF